MRQNPVRDDSDAIYTALQRRALHPGYTEKDWQAKQAREVLSAFGTAALVLLTVLLAVALWVTP